MTRLRMAVSTAGLTIFFGLSVYTTPPQSFATRQAGAQPAAPGMIAPGRSDDHPGPLAARQRELTSRALEARLRGKAKGPTHEVARGQYVELARQREDRIWTVLAEFGDTIDPAVGGTPGPRRNQIPAPDPQSNFFTPWTADFSRTYYERVLFAEAPDAVSMPGEQAELDHSYVLVPELSNDVVKLFNGFGLFEI